MSIHRVAFDHIASAKAPPPEAINLMPASAARHTMSRQSWQGGCSQTSALCVPSAGSAPVLHPLLRLLLGVAGRLIAAARKPCRLLRARRAPTRKPRTTPNQPLPKPCVRQAPCTRNHGAPTPNCRGHPMRAWPASIEMHVGLTARQVGPVWPGPEPEQPQLHCCNGHPGALTGCVPRTVATRRSLGAPTPPRPSR